MINKVLQSTTPLGAYFWSVERHPDNPALGALKFSWINLSPLYARTANIATKMKSKKRSIVLLFN